MRAFGWIVLAAVVAVGYLHFGGFLDSDVDVKVTNKGQVVLNETAQAARETLNKGIDKAQESIGNLKVEHVPVKPKTESQETKSVPTK